MNDEPHPQLDPSNSERLNELLADRALFGLDEAEQRELDTLLASSNLTDVESFDRVAASAQLASLGQTETLPAGLAQKLIEQGQQTLSTGVVSKVRTTQPTTVLPTTAYSRRELLAWFSAAAALAGAWFAVSRGPTAQSAVALRAELLAQSDAVTQIAWSSGGDAAGMSATGDLVWHNGRQQGVMQFKNLAANDPSKTQYQLWIFDKAQDERYPVDGGVFNVPAGADEVFVKIDAKLPIVDPTLFAITIEKPGGVVVSSRERLPLLAKVE